MIFHTFFEIVMKRLGKLINMHELYNESGYRRGLSQI